MELLVRSKDPVEVAERGSVALDEPVRDIAEKGVGRARSAAALSPLLSRRRAKDSLLMVVIVMICTTPQWEELVE